MLQLHCGTIYRPISGGWAAYNMHCKQASPFKRIMTSDTKLDYTRPVRVSQAAVNTSVDCAKSTSSFRTIFL
jgi:hypothetical protein